VEHTFLSDDFLVFLRLCNDAFVHILSGFSIGDDSES